MKQIRDTEEIQGKTIARIYHCFEDLWIRFTDGTFVIFRAETEYGSTSLVIDPKAPNLLANTSAAIAIELATPEAIVALQKEKSDAQKRAQEERERADLERLLAKYPRP